MTTYPHLDQPWVDAFILEARLRDATGSAIGAALAEAESHCADSGESASEAFGDPKEYAASLSLRSQRGSLLASSVGGLISIVGLLMLPRAARALKDAAAVDITVGDVATFAVLATLIALVTARSGAALRWLTGLKLWQAVLVSFLFIATLVGIMLVASGTAFTAPALPTAIIGAVAVTAGAVVTWRTLRQDADVAVVGPNEKPAQAPAGTALFTVLALPIATAVLTALALL